MMLYNVGPYVSTLSLIPRAFAVEAGRNYSKFHVIVNETDKKSLDQGATQQTQITKSLPNSTSVEPPSILPLNRIRDFKIKAVQGEEAVECYSENEKNIVIKDNISEADMAKDLNDNTDGKPTDPYSYGIVGIKPTDTKSSDTVGEKPTDNKNCDTVGVKLTDNKSSDIVGVKLTDTKSSVVPELSEIVAFTAVKEEQNNGPHESLEVTEVIDQEEDFFNDYPDGKKDDQKEKSRSEGNVMYKQTLRDEYSPYVRRLLLKESEKPNNMASKMENKETPCDKTIKSPSAEVTKTYDDLAKLCLKSSNNDTQKWTSPVYSNNYSKDIINRRPVQPIVLNHSKIPMSNTFPSETYITTFDELAMRFLKTTDKNEKKKVGPVIVNIKNTFNQRNQPGQPNVLNYRKNSNYIPPFENLGNRKSRIPKNKLKIQMSEADVNKQLDDIARTCLKSPINKTDKIILEQLAKRML